MNVLPACCWTARLSSADQRSGLITPQIHLSITGCRFGTEPDVVLSS